MRSVCVFCGSSSGFHPAYAEAAKELGEILARRGLRLIYGGGNIGLMGVLADAVLAGGGEVIGVIPQALEAKELAHRGVTDLQIVGSMHERKQRMAAQADAFIAMPGGYGTLEEFCEVLTWSQLGLHQKPCGVLNVAGYFDPLLQLFDRAVAEGFLRSTHRAIVLVDTSCQSLLEQLAAFTPVTKEKWIDPRQS
jgi:uncharacterized protein (TIGR00730 family)